MANQSVNSSKDWEEQRSKFSELSMQWHSNKDTWWTQQEERERLQKEWNELVATQKATLNFLTLGITYVTGITDDQVEVENVLRNLSYTQNTVAFARKSKEFLDSVREYREELSQRRDNIAGSHEQLLLEDKERLESALRDYDIAAQANQFSSDEMSACRRTIDTTDIKLSDCNRTLDEIEDEMKKCESLERSVLNEIKSCDRQLRLSAKEIENGQNRVMRCIDQLKELSAKYSKIAIGAGVGSVAAGATAAGVTLAMASGPVGWIIGGTAAAVAFGVGVGGLAREISVQKAKERFQVCEDDLKKTDNIVQILKDILYDCSSVLKELETIIMK